MKGKFRIYVLGSIPPDLKERIASMHAAAIMNPRKEEISITTPSFNSYADKPVRRSARRVNH